MCSARWRAAPSTQGYGDVAEHNVKIYATVAPQDSCSATKSYLARIDPATNRVDRATPADCAFGIATVGDSLWVFSDNNAPTGFEITPG